MKVALTHDYLREYGGAERVLETLHEMFPDAPVYTAYYNPQGLGDHAKKFKGWDIKTSWMQKMPFANKLISPFRIFAPMIFENFDMREYDLVISSSSAVYFAKAVITRPGSLNISYIHTPPRFLYGYTTSFNYKKRFVTRVLGELANHFLRMIDFEVSQRPDILVANSKNIQERIRKFYRRESVVIYPPVQITSFPRKREYNNGSPIRSGMTREYFLSVGRLVRGKGIEVIVSACSKLGLALKIVGSGPELEALEKIAGKKVEFLGNVPDEELPELYAGAKALIVASEDEDFGITPVEAQAFGTAVIAIATGGFLETVLEGKTGEFFPSSSTSAMSSVPNGSGQVDSSTYVNQEVVENLIKVLKKFNPGKYKREDLIKNAQKFSKERFKKEMKELIEKNLKS